MGSSAFSNGKLSVREWEAARRFVGSSASVCRKLCADERVAPRQRLKRVWGETVEINKDLIAASSTPIILALLAESDSYGYAILQSVREMSGGHLTWTDGMLYPVLHRLERFGHIEARWQVAESGRRRKYYSITPQGRAQLEEERKQWQAVDATLRGMWRTLSVEAAVHTSRAMPALGNG